MQYRDFGKTGLKVSEVGFGANNIGYIPEAQAEQVLNLAIDMGVALIDTAASYLNSEGLIGKYLSHRKEDFIVATKCGTYEKFVNGERQVIADYTPQCVLQTIDESRRKLNTDVLDIVQFHHCRSIEMTGRPHLTHCWKPSPKVGQDSWECRKTSRLRSTLRRSGRWTLRSLLITSSISTRTLL